MEQGGYKLALKEENSVQSVERALSILEYLAEEKRACGITEIGNAVSLHKSTVHRLIKTLVNKGYIEQEIDSDKYSLGNRVLFLAGSVLDRMDVRNIARPYIVKLSERVNEVVHLSILDGDEAVYIDKVEGLRQGSFRMNSQIGKRVPLYCTAVGKVMLSKLEDEEVAKILSHYEMRKYTTNTITDVESFIKELAKTRQLGYATDEMEHEEGIRCIAAPIYDRKGDIVAAISISGPVFYITEERFPYIKIELLNTAENISKQLGYMKNFSKLYEKQ